MSEYLFFSCKKNLRDCAIEERKKNEKKYVFVVVVNICVKNIEKSLKIINITWSNQLNLNKLMKYHQIVNELTTIKKEVREIPKSGLMMMMKS